MIIDKAENLCKYKNILLYTDDIIKFINNYDESNCSQGKHNIKGDSLFVLVQKYKTKDEDYCRPESHQKYIDIQYIVKGNETILWDNIDNLHLKEDKSEEADILFYERKEGASRLNLKEGMFAVFLPEDAHTPCISYGASKEILKMVFKIKLSEWDYNDNAYFT